MKRQSILAASLLVALTMQAEEDLKTNMFNPAIYSATSLMIAPDARAGGMGDVGVATDPDVNSQYWNPAKYPFCISRAGVAFNYTPWLRSLVNDIDLANVAGYYRIGDYSALSSSLRYFSLGEVITEQGGTIKPYEFAFDIGYSRMLSETFSAGVALRYIYSDLGDHSSDDSTPGSAFAADVSCYYNNYFMAGNRECQLGLGLNINNIGSKINYGGDDNTQFIPTNLRIGASVMIPVDEYNRFSISADANKLLIPTYPVQNEGESNEDFEQRKQSDYYDLSPISGIFKSFGDAPGGFSEEMKEIQWSVGAEYCYNDKFTVRAGYHDEAATKGNRKYFTVGAGFRMSVFSLDCGYVISTAQSNPLDQTLRFSLAFDMDGIKDLLHRGNR